MIKNVSGSRVIIGKFRIENGCEVPFDKMGEEDQISVKRFITAGFLKEEQAPAPKQKAKTKAEPETKAQEVKKTEPEPVAEAEAEQKAKAKK